MSDQQRPIDTTIDVVTPENIAFQYQVAGPFVRLWAFLMDILIRLGIWLLLWILLMISGFTGWLDPAFTIALALLFWFTMEWFYGGIFEAYWNGQTPGKRMVGLRVLQAGGQSITALQAVMRNILRLVDLMPLIPLLPLAEARGPFLIPTCLVGLVSMILTSRFQRLGDLVCGTMVVIEPKNWFAKLAQVKDARALELARQLPPGLRLTRQQARAVAAYVDRRGVFSLEHRRDVARHFAMALIDELDLPANTDPDLLLCAVYQRVFITDQQAESWSLASLKEVQAEQGVGA